MHNYSPEIEFDPAKAAENLQQHGAIFAHAEQVLRDPNAVTVGDPDAQGEQRFVTLGWTRWAGLWSSFTRRAMVALESYPLGRRANQRQLNMRKEYDFSRGKRGATITSSGKTRITIMLDDAVIEAFRSKAEAAGRGYQTLINEALRASLKEDSRPLTAKVMREIVREELAHAR